jgi:hypothetical protein
MVIVRFNCLMWSGIASDDFRPNDRAVVIAFNNDIFTSAARQYRTPSARRQSPHAFRKGVSLPVKS